MHKDAQANFDRWFEASQVVNLDGSPMVVYHGTPNYGFTEFNKSLMGSRDKGDFGKGFYFSPSKSYASSYEVGGDLINKHGDGSKTYAVYVALKNPLKISARRGAPSYIDDEYDGVMIYSDKFYELPFGHPKNLVEVVAFRPEQIKSATENSGLYDRSNPDITDRIAAAGAALDYLAGITTKKVTPHA